MSKRMSPEDVMCEINNEGLCYFIQDCAGPQHVPEELEELHKELQEKLAAYLKNLHHLIVDTGGEWVLG